MATTIPCDLALVGGGLAGCLIALAVRARNPGARLCVVEQGPSLGGNHVWSLFDTDLGPDGRALVEPLIAHRWPAYDVAFPKHRRTIHATYQSITNDRLDAVVRAALPADAVLTERLVEAVTPTSVSLAGGDRIEAAGVIDTRGAADLSLLRGGWQKFVGLELACEHPHGLDRPVVMDATVEQIDGYRFVYCLPFSPTRVFVEDTYYSDTPDLDVPAIEARIGAYAAARGWRARAVGRAETGVLPVVTGGDVEGYWRSGGAAVAKAGARGALFHPTTGYSLPDAVRVALMVAGAADRSGAALHRLLHDEARRAWRQRGYYRMLDRMLFGAAAPAERYRVLERFYRLDPGLIARFYAGQSTLADKARILAGKPPVPILRAIAALRAGA